MRHPYRERGTRFMRRKNDLGSGRIGVLVGRIALPSMLAQFVSVLYSIVDRMYIGHIPGVGALALAGVGVCGPVVTMVGLGGLSGGRWRRAADEHQAWARATTDAGAGHSGQLLFDAVRVFGGAARAPSCPSASPCCGCSAQATPPTPMRRRISPLYLLQVRPSRCCPPA